ncbi:class I SAM-dependent methyltransferase [Mycobacteroides abscessus]|uniref:class I SAM-dependent methyltransferase n=1 Tax=Mycobacteroides abscessus TaxID=36809 RepID=UPI0005DB820F|nr:class I SAM-dependent methyltransferase [Mycobacteroides abscessus]AMU23992.1 SAM-dependent methyltransferase [Mycobacteroides abscessus]MBN7301324.1 class I SAM-dependent methyltransferase [Mycobacteroides abscessus subsp. bolletii]CPW47346.1 thiopurine S-methyltransferase (tpmt) superfamily protein [Mycobacteroides abscessus]SHT82984.1 putative SAM-dependent methyltransferase [Mycobacteroides abscessus subsp. bolletii]SHX44018.1 putative SAM-dependent methyltransferase [Mycobacteroides ab
MTQVMNWDDAYRQRDRPAWNIGEPQPEYAALIDQDGAVRGEVLDAGCGYAELALALAARGHTVVGIDLAPTAVEAATAAALERGLRTATFQQADISSFTGYDGRFSTVFDSGLLHALPPELRVGYLRSVHRAAAPGAQFYILAFGTGAFPNHDQPAPAEFSEDQLRKLVSTHWFVESIRPARLQAGTGPESVLLPGYLLAARKA